MNHLSFVLQRTIYVGSHSGVVQVPMSACQRYTSCYDCVFARDPFCGWDGRACVEISSRAQRWGNTHLFTAAARRQTHRVTYSVSCLFVQYIWQKTNQILAETNAFAPLHHRSWVYSSLNLLCCSTCLFCLLLLHFLFFHIYQLHAAE